jgi:hypothetical protein
MKSALLFRLCTLLFKFESLLFKFSRVHSFETNVARMSASEIHHRRAKLSYLFCSPGLEMANNRFALLIVSLVSAAGVWAVANVPSVPLPAVHKFALNDGKFKVQNIADGNFPANPTYAAIKQYADAECSELYIASSYLLDTCMSSATTSVQYTCGTKKSRLLRVARTLPSIAFNEKCSGWRGSKNRLQ